MQNHIVTSTLEREIVRVLSSEQLEDAERFDLAGYARNHATRHEALFLVKPEIGAACPESLDKVFSRIGKAFREYSVEVSLVSVLSGQHIKETGFLDRTYWQVSRVSARGWQALPESALLSFMNSFGLPSAQTALAGANEFLETHQDLDAQSLAGICNASGMVRLAGGVYCSRVELDGQMIFVLNGFYPLQVKRFTDPFARTVAMVLHTDRAWRALRHDMLGATNPHKAKPGSLRSWLKRNEAELGIEPVDAMRNGLHLSAGPIEAAREVANAIRDCVPGGVASASETGIGTRLQAEGIDREVLEWLTSNPCVVTAEGVVPVFDLTEDMDVTECATAVIGSQLEVQQDASLPARSRGYGRAQRDKSSCSREEGSDAVEPPRASTHFRS